MKKSRLATELMSALIYCQALLVFAGIASALMHGPENGDVTGARTVATAQPL